MNIKHRLSLVTTSWDDGHPLDLRIADLLAKYGLTGTFYVLPERWPRMTRSEIRELSSRFEVGSHTFEHRRLDTVGNDEVRNQLAASRQWIEDVTGRSCRIFCFPGGKYRRQQLSLVREAGYQAARTTELLSTQFPRRVDGLSLIPTTVQVFPHSLLAYSRNAVRRLSLRKLVQSAALFSARDWLQLAEHLLQRTVRRGGVFHVWGHSWEVEQEHQWERLEQLASMMSATREQLTNVTNSELEKYAV
jgi:peptidoglycan/xylan/chitin deacetylase (PgdA/CDA1 family)